MYLLIGVSAGTYKTNPAPIRRRPATEIFLPPVDGEPGRFWMVTWPVSCTGSQRALPGTRDRTGEVDWGNCTRKYIRSLEGGCNSVN